MKSLNLPYSPRIDQLRWFAATLVFLYHYSLAWRGAGGAGLSSPWLGLITEGHTGVALFFTLSGFLFMRIAQRQRQIAYRPFIRNRLLRVAPLYLVVFLLALSIGRDKFQPQDVLYVLSANLGNAPTSQTVVTGAAWCIPLEFLFYLLFPFLAKFVLEQGATYLWRLLALMLFFKVMVYGENERATLMYFSTFVGRFDQFLIGMLAAVLFQRHQPWLARLAGWLLLPAVALAVGDSALQAHLAPFNVVPRTPFWIGWSMLESAVWAVLIVLWVSWQGRLPVWLERVMTHGGKISFSFYLLHMGVVQPLARTFGAPVLTGMPALDAALALALVYGAVWAVATLSYHAIEEPFLRLRSSYGTVPVPASTH
ncbi:acyltransferase family protein [Duganella sp. FT50W]|uniref:Acyltransferase family protein n=1 Tax=Duganella lactea TaxID=2692173 RepID=A0A6L8MSM0_9BURK|nr:acyltransferase [Duganella lactea]MYM85048.1 acyltransferase family protein [Duganella lactea]